MFSIVKYEIFLWIVLSTAIASHQNQLFNIFNSTNFTQISQSNPFELSKLFSGKSLAANLKRIRECFEGHLDNFKIDLFDPKLSIIDHIDQYYKIFSWKNPTTESVSNLVQSIKFIISHVFACVFKPKTYKVGLTEWSDQNLDKIQNPKYDTEIRNSMDSNDFLAEQNLFKRSIDKCYPPENFRKPNKIDWRKSQIITPIRHQGKCGACWAFSVVGTVESALIRSKNASQNIRLSPQELVDNVWKNYGCNGGTTYPTFQYIKLKGITGEKNYPYKAKQSYKMKKPPRVARISDYCVRSRYRHSLRFKREKLTDSDIENAVAYFGPTTMLINSNNEVFKNYKSGTIDFDSCPTRVDHVVMLIGYDRQNWILKNSWGTRWGEDGFFRVAKGKNLCGINFEIAYPIV